MTALMWFRKDLRLTDNSALLAACARCAKIIPVYVHAPEEMLPWAPGAASNWWLHHSLADLEAALHSRGSRLIVRRGPSVHALLTLAQETGATHVFWNRSVEPSGRARDQAVASALQAAGIQSAAYNSCLMHDPGTFLKKDGTPYRVFTRFWQALAATLQLTAPRPAPQALPAVPVALSTLPLTELALLPEFAWTRGLEQTWHPGEQGAWEALGQFLTPQHLSGYPLDRDFPARNGTSRLSPHLHFGEISPNQVAWAVREMEALHPGSATGTSAFMRELGWREFAYYILWHFPHTTDEPMDIRFHRFPWREQHTHLSQAWQRGRTGIPIVDAGMRELWQTGWMHNRVRMVVASFLTKHCRVAWQEGARWFWDTLVDADLANNSLNWQWTAGCGVDAAPFFRIFNPTRQSERFDPNGDYLRRWLPELMRLSATHLHAPWMVPPAVLASAGVTLGSTYPKPVVNLDEERKAALEAYAALKTR